MKKTIINFISTFITTFIVVIALLLILVKVTGCSMYTIESSSMAPELQVGTLVVVKPTEFEEIETGDIISYVLNEKGTIVTHRVTDIDESSESFTTKGDMNDAEDAAVVYYENVIGVVIFKIPYIGNVFKIIQNHKKMTLGLVFILLIGTIISNLITKIKQEKTR